MDIGQWGQWQCPHCPTYINALQAGCSEVASQMWPAGCRLPTPPKTVYGQMVCMGDYKNWVIVMIHNDINFTKPIACL